MAEGEQQKRLVAYKSRIKELLDGKYVKEEGWNPNYIEAKGRKISRANIIGTVVSKEDVDKFQSLVLDDGTGKITVRSFEKNPLIDSIDVGDVVLIIGRPREYGSERYVLIEIIKKIENKKWILYRKAELEDNSFVEEDALAENKPVNNNSVEEMNVVAESVDSSSDSSAETILKRIKEYDLGEGADFDSVIKGIGDGEKVVRMLLSEGDVFEIKPGRLKVLE